MRLVFLGTPQFAVPTLDHILHAGHEVLAVFTQPDRPKGRGGSLAASPVKEAALAHGLRIEQPPRIKRPEVVETLAALRCDAMVVVGYGQIISQAIIDLAPLGIINVHGSLLPKYRGAAPIQWAIANGETVTGVTTMRIDAGLDTGDMLLKWETAIVLEETAIELGARMATAGAALLVETLARIEAGKLTGEPQDPTLATYAPILKKEDGLIDWNQPAATIHNRARGFFPWPGAYSFFRGQLFNIWKTQPSLIAPGTPASAHIEGTRLLIRCGGSTTLELLEVQLQGRKRISAEAFLNGHRVSENEILGTPAT